MSNVSSAGLFGGRVGTSMDCSQLIATRRKYANIHQVRTEVNSANPPLIPRFNKDKFYREPGSNGAVDYYFTRGLTPLFTSIGNTK